MSWLEKYRISTLNNFVFIMLHFSTNYLFIYLIHIQTYENKQEFSTTSPRYWKGGGEEFFYKIGKSYILICMYTNILSNFNKGNREGLLSEDFFQFIKKLI